MEAQNLPKLIGPKLAFQAQAGLGARALGGVQVRLYLAWPFPFAGCSCPGWGPLGTLHHLHWQAAAGAGPATLHSHAWSPLPCLLSCPLASHQERARGLRAGTDSEPQ